MKNSFDYDLIVIGAGSGGVRASRMAADRGAKVAIFESKALGGTCVNVGCVPKKLFVYGALYGEYIHEAQNFGWLTTNTNWNWSTLLNNKNQEIERLNTIYHQLLEKSGVAIINEIAILQNKHTIYTNKNTYTAKNILLTPGSKAFIPQFAGNQHVITSDQAFYLNEIPQEIVIVGGGYIALEFASIFNGLGVKTLLIYRGDLFLKGFDYDLRLHIKQELEKKGIQISFNQQITRINQLSNKKLQIIFANNEQHETDQIMYATGRIPNIDHLALDKIGIKTRENGEIIVNDYYQTSIPNIFALGDVIGGMNLTPVAIAEAMNFIANLFDKQKSVMDYSLIPTAVFTIPHLATVGLTEDAAKKQNIPYKIYKTSFRHLKNNLCANDEKIFLKMIVHKETDRVLGCHMIGNDAGEIIQGLAIALKSEATKKMFDQTLGIHPTVAEEWVTMR